MYFPDRFRRSWRRYYSAQVCAQTQEHHVFPISRNGPAIRHNREEIKRRTNGFPRHGVVHYQLLNSGEIRNVKTQYHFLPNLGIKSRTPHSIAARDQRGQSNIKPATLFPATVTPESQNHQWRPPEKRRGNEARRVPEKRLNCLGSRNEII